MSKYIPGEGPFNPKLMIVGDCPTEYDLPSGKYFSGSPGRILDEFLRKAGIRRDSCWLTAVSKYPVPRGNKGDKRPFSVRAQQANIDFIEQSQHLLDEINAVQPNCILALGSSALRAITGKNSIQHYRGSILQGMGRKIVATYHPNDLVFPYGGEIKGYYNRKIMEFDVERAVKQSAFPDVVRPIRNLQVCRSSFQLEEFIKHHENCDKLSIDIEALDCIPTCIGIAFSSNAGLSVPLWNTRGISKIPDSDLVNIWILLARLLMNPRYKKIGQNFKYDEDKLVRLGLPIHALHSDTMLKAFTINPELPKGLAFLTSIYTEEPYYKGEGANFDPSVQSIDDLFIYNARDAAVTMEIDDKMDSELEELELTDFYHNFIMKLHPLYLEIENEGFLVDEKAREELLRKYIRKEEETDYELFKLCGMPVNTQSPKQVSILLYEHLGIPGRAGTGEEELTVIINGAKTTELQKKICTLILESRQIKKTKGAYLMAMPDYDGRMRTTYFLCTDTGRTSTGQQDPPIRPLFEYRDYDGKKKSKALGTAFQTITKHGDIGGDVRSMYIADPGDVFIQGDSEQAEARVVFLLADDEQALKDIDEHDYHALTTSWFFGGSEYDYSKKVLGYESPKRFIGKTLRHAGHLGASPKRASLTVNTDARKFKIPVEISESFAKIALATFHRKQPKLQQVFHAAVVEHINKTRHLIAPVPYGIDTKYGGRRTFFERHGDDLNRQAFAYIPQRAVTDNTKAAAIRIKRRIPWAKIILEAHDGLLFRVRENRAEEAGYIIKEEMERPIRFDTCSIPRRDLVIPCALEIGYNYKDLDKFKLRARVA